MRKVLVFIDWFHPGFKSGGPATSNLSMVQALHGDYDFVVATRNSDYTEPDKPYEGIVPDSLYDFGNYEACYFSESNTKYKSVKKLIKDINAEFLYINGIYSLRFSVFPLIAGRKAHRGKIIIAPRGMLSRQALEVKWFKKDLFLRIMKLFRMYKGVTFHCTNQSEANDVKAALGSNTSICIAGNFTKPISDLTKTYKKTPGNLHLIYIGRISDEKNLSFLLRVLPLVKDVNIELSIYGSVYSPDYWLECDGYISKLPANISAVWGGDLKPEQIPDVLSKAGFLISPTLGENFGHAIVESLGSGTPAIISNRTPWHSDGSESGIFEIPLEDPELWATTLEKLGSISQEEYERLSRAAKEFALKNTGNDKLKPLYQKLFG